VQAVVSAHPLAPSSSRPPSCWPVPRHVCLRNPIKSTLAHDAVAAVVLRKHHLIIRVGAGLIQFVYGSHSRLAADLTLDKKSIFAAIFAGLTNLLTSLVRSLVFAQFILLSVTDLSESLNSTILRIRQEREQNCFHCIFVQTYVGLHSGRHPIEVGASRRTFALFDASIS